MEPSPSLRAEKFNFATLRDVLTLGWQHYRRNPLASSLYASIFALIGLLLLGALGYFGLSPMALPFAGGFMLIGPVLLCGYFRLLERSEAGQSSTFADALVAFRKAPMDLWVLTLFCSFLFLIWITDAATLYAFMIGGEYLPYHLPWLIEMKDNVVAFELWGSLMGSVIAFIIMAISAFSVPLIYQRRASLVNAITASVRAVLGNFLNSILWGLILTGSTMLSILLLPLLTIVLPVLAYASYELYRRVYPQAVVEEKAAA